MLLVLGTVGIVVLGGCFVVGVWVFRTGQEAVQEVTGSETGLGGFLEDLQENPARVAAETVIRVNPELDLVSTDEAAGTITFRNNRTGEEATLNFDDIAEGRFTMTTSEGEFSMDASEAVAEGSAEGGVTFSGPDGTARIGGAADLDSVPAWVPLYPNATETQGTYQTASGDRITGAVTARTGDSAQEVLDHYEQALEAEGYTIVSRTMNETPSGVFGAFSASLEAEGREVTIAVTGQDGEVQVIVNYEGRP